MRLKAAGYARDATVPLCAARIAGTTASKGSKGETSCTHYRGFTLVAKARAYARSGSDFFELEASVNAMSRRYASTKY